MTEEFLSKKDISEVIFSIQNIDPKNLRKLVEGLVEYPVQVKIVPPVEDWINGELRASQIKQVQIEDLLDRAPITIKNQKIDKQLSDKVVLVTGGAGSIGSELVRQICSYGYKSLIIIDQAESALYDLQQDLKQNGYHNFIPIVGDIRDKNRMNAIFQEYKPNMVFHAAAYKHVPLMEYMGIDHVKYGDYKFNTIKPIESKQKYPKYYINHSFMFDYKLGEYLISPLINLAHEHIPFVRKRLISQIKDFNRQFIRKLPDDFFPPDWCHYANVNWTEEKKTRVYIWQDDPKYR